jgi:hypothetical protein
VSEREPSQAEVQQAEPEAYEPMEVAVRVEGPVRAQTLPATSYTDRTFDLDATTAVRVAPRDPRRSVLLMTPAAAVWIGPVQSAAKVTVGGLLVANTPVYHRHTEEVWAIAATGSTTLSVHEEFWTE